MVTSFDKAIVAFIMAGLGLAQWFTEYNLGWITSDQVASIIALATPLLVWVVPNKKAPVAAPAVTPPAV